MFVRRRVVVITKLDRCLVDYFWRQLSIRLVLGPTESAKADSRTKTSQTDTFFGLDEIGNVALVNFAVVERFKTKNC
jgi:hypothetical protein